MEAYISKMVVLDRMEETKTYFELERKHMAASAVKDCIKIVEKLEPRTVSYEPEKAKRTVSVEPYFPGGQIGREVYRCGWCTTQIDKKDKYCRFCGRKLVDPE